MGLAPLGKRHLSRRLRARWSSSRPTGSASTRTISCRSARTRACRSATTGEMVHAPPLFGPRRRALRRAPRADTARSRSATWTSRSGSSGSSKRAYMHLLEHRCTGWCRTTRIAMAGGCVLNSVANGKLFDRHAVPRDVHPARRRRRRAGARRGALRQQRGAARGQALRDDGRLSRPRSSARPRSGRSSIAQESATSEIERDRCCDATVDEIVSGQRRRLVPGPHGMGAARARQPFDPGASRLSRT